MFKMLIYTNVQQLYARNHQNSIIKIWAKIGPSATALAWSAAALACSRLERCSAPSRRCLAEGSSAAALGCGAAALPWFPAN